MEEILTSYWEMVTAVSKELFGKQCFHYNMRTNLMEFIQNHPNMFEPLVFQGSLDQHCKKVSKPGAFATQVEMQAMTTFYKCLFISILSKSEMDPLSGNGYGILLRKYHLQLINTITD